MPALQSDAASTSTSNQQLRLTSAILLAAVKSLEYSRASRGSAACTKTWSNKVTRGVPNKCTSYRGAEQRAIKAAGPVCSPYSAQTVCSPVLGLASRL